MEKTVSKLTIFFEEPFWVGIYEREISKQLQDTGIGTKAQQALKLQQEQGKLDRKLRSCAQREAELHGGQAVTFLRGSLNYIFF